MTINTMVSKLGLTKIQSEYTDKEIKNAYTGDLLSDVMGNAAEESIIITIQAHKNTVAVAVLKESPAIIVCNGRQIPSDMIEAAKAENIAIFATNDDQFVISGRLFKLLECQ